MKKSILSAEELKKDNELKRDFTVINGGSPVKELGLPDGSQINAVISGALISRGFKCEFKNEIETEFNRPAKGVILRSISVESSGRKFNASITPDTFEKLVSMDEEQRPVIGDSVVCVIRSYKKEGETIQFLSAEKFGEIVNETEDVTAAAIAE